ncbi:protein EMBRYO SAC DEVELOPMENT ARREST 3, chloroplastic [Iris pallida]|uniref:Protein EMBRYO SAC DEVELOPMENT ARREST 3, chloroplastic n=1 Tax=Iris pallida TaxID=29817 RepID=A0AAX6ILG2_IRIPA|nr:protein EMBRYO SAC DEVELOPMENT ARREST 3, chloroplastic [Iris pallida]
MASLGCCFSGNSLFTSPESIRSSSSSSLLPIPSIRIGSRRRRRSASIFLLVRASSSSSAVDSSESSSFDFVKRMEQAWLISQQPGPVACSSCKSNGRTECKWCGGTGFFIIGNNMLCEVPSRNTSCIICTGKGSTCCSDCKGTGFRAKWLDKPSPPH